MRAFRSVATISTTSLFCLGILSARPANAASEEDKAGARAAATQGVKAFEAKKWAQALDLFTRAESLVHSQVHLLYKARALVQLGQLVKANETYLSITREPRPTTASEAVNNADESAVKEQAALESRLANLTVNLDGPGAADATVTMDGMKVSSALVGVGRPADPGQHTLQAASPTSQSDAQTVTLKEGATANVTLVLKPIPGAIAAAVPPAGATPPVSGATPPMTSGAVDVGASSSGGNGLRTASYVALGVGAVGLIGGAVFSLQAKSKYQDGNNLCKGMDPCNLSSADASQRTQLGKDADRAKTLGIVGFVVGGIGVAAGTTLFILSTKKESEPTRAGVHPWIGVGSVGLDGRF